MQAHAHTLADMNSHDRRKTSFPNQFLLWLRVSRFFLAIYSWDWAFILVVVVCMHNCVPSDQVWVWVSVAVTRQKVPFALLFWAEIH